MRIAIAAIAGLAALAGAMPASAQSGMTLAVGRITTTQTCKYFQESAGRAGVVATPWAVAAAASWRTWWVKDCVSNFATMRSTLEAALASSGALRVGTRGAHYTVSINVTGISGGDGPAPTAPDGQEWAISQTLMVVSMDVSVRDSAGRVVFGGLLTKKVEVGSDAKVDGFRATSNASGEAAYGKMQNELALAAARMVAFHFAPIQVTGTQGKQVQLNYGGPLLQLGALIMIASPDHRAVIRYRVSVASSDFSTAIVDGSGDFQSIVPGSIGTYIEADDPAANSRRYEKVELP